MGVRENLLEVPQGIIKCFQIQFTALSPSPSPTVKHRHLQQRPVSVESIKHRNTDNGLCTKDGKYYGMERERSLKVFFCIYNVFLIFVNAVYLWARVFVCV